jgi:hypothetical protein
MVGLLDGQRFDRCALYAFSCLAGGLRQGLLVFAVPDELQSGVQKEDNLDTTTLLIIIVVLLVLGGGWYGRGRWY